MKQILLVLLAFLIATFTVYCQPNTTSTIKAGIVNPIPGKTYHLFMQVENDTLNNRLIDNMDYLNPDVSDLKLTGLTWTQVGDTLFTTIEVPDGSQSKWAKGGLVKEDNITHKYSGMVVSFWETIDVLESRPEGFIWRRE